LFFATLATAALSLLLSLRHQN